MENRKLIARIGIGFLQGFVLYMVGSREPWGKDNPGLYSGLVAAWTLAPVALNLGLLSIRWRSLIAWLAILSGFCFWVATHAAHNRPGESYREFGNSLIQPLGLFAFAIVGQSLITAQNGLLRTVRPYALYFDAAWKLAVQIALGLAFVGALQLVLGIGSALFDLLGVKLYDDVLRSGFGIVLECTLAFAAGIHLTDVRPAIIRGVRTLKLNLFSWLLPFITLIVTGFLVTLLLVGYNHSGNQHGAAEILLAAGFVIVYLVNTAYQDGDTEQTRNAFLRLTCKISCGVLFVLMMVAAYRLNIRVMEDGLSPSRVEAIAMCVLLACYSTGYAWAIIRREPWLKAIEQTNIMCAWAILVLVVAILTPIADPDKLSTWNQMERLRSGAVAADKFDYIAIYDYGRYGRRAIIDLAAHGNTPDIRTTAQKTVAGTALRDAPPDVPADFNQKFAVYPVGAAIPTDFWTELWKTPELQRFQWCGQTHTSLCEAILTSGISQVPYVILRNSDSDARQAIFSKRDGHWTSLGDIDVPQKCSALLKSGNIEVVKSEVDAVKIDGHTMPIIPTRRTDSCP